jgi:hypothetical protein
MTQFYLPSETDLMAEAKRALAARRQYHDTRTAKSLQSPTPVNERRIRSLRSCHRPRHDTRSHYESTVDTGAYVPELSARLDNDRNLTDGARRCARKIAELTYRANRAGRSLDVTVTYLMTALGRCRRTIQRYLRQLEESGYISVDVVKGKRSRMCVGLVVKLLAPLFARHHRKKWPERREDPGATQESQNQRYIDSIKEKPRLISRHEWAARCMDGVFRSLMKTLQPFDLALPTPQ